MGRNTQYPLPKSIDEALFYRFFEVAPLRPRNNFERDAKAKFTGRRNPGRLVNVLSRTQVALDYARYLVNTDKVSMKSAAKMAAVASGLNCHDNIRRLLRAALQGPQVIVKPRPKKGGLFQGLIQPKMVPFFVGAVNASTGEIFSCTTDEDGANYLNKVKQKIISSSD